MKAIPDKAFAQTVAILGRTGSGKSYTARGQVEHVLARGERVCIIDPTGVWWGLKSMADGKREGYPVAIFGGLHADVEIAEASAVPLANIVAAENLPTIVDVSEMGMGERTRFMTHFLETLFKANRKPLTLVIDEADMFAPQRPMPDQTVMLNRMEHIVRRGRVRGFRPWLITQRPAELHKAVLTQASTLVAMQLTSPQDRTAMGAWIDGQGDAAIGKTILAELPKMPPGTGYLWAPGLDFLERVTFPKIKTFDSMRTPEHGETIEPPSKLADVDLGDVLEALKPPEPPAPKEKAARVAQPDPKALEEAEQRGYRRGYITAQAETLARCRAAFQRAEPEIFSAVVDAELPEVPRAAAAPVAAQPERTVRATRTAGAATDASLPRAERLILAALAQYPDGRSKTQLAILTGYSSQGGGFRNSIGALRTKEMLVGGSELLVITTAGIDAIGDFDPLPVGVELRDYWMAKLSRAERESLRALCDAYPRALTKQQVANAAGYEAAGGGFRNALGKLRTLELIKGTREMKASQALFA